MPALVDSARASRRADQAAGPLARGGLLPETFKIQNHCLSHNDTTGFNGERVHAVQIGLGTFSTIPQNLAGIFSEQDTVLHWLLSSVSENRPEHFRGVVVEPVQEHLEKVRSFAPKLPHMKFVQAAISDEDSRDVELQVLTRKSRDALVNSVSQEQQRPLQDALEYVRNMSCVGGTHPSFGLSRKNMWRNYGIDLHMERLGTEVWNYATLASNLDFCGCGLLLIDTEGHDTRIVRSMIKHCQEQELQGRNAWPDLIVFETAGICDRSEGFGSEADAVKQLEDSGYLCFVKTRMNTDMLNRKALQRSEHLQKWTYGAFCTECRKTTEVWPLTLRAGKMCCFDCLDEQHRAWVLAQDCPPMPSHLQRSTQ